MCTVCYAVNCHLAAQSSLATLPCLLVRALSIHPVSALPPDCFRTLHTYHLCAAQGGVEKSHRWANS